MTTDSYFEQIKAQRDAARTALANESARSDAAESERDAAYRERAQLLAWLAAVHSSVITDAPDVGEPGWQLLYLHAGGHQMSWHIHPEDADLFAHVEQVPVGHPLAQWDGHTTEQKYQRITAHIAMTIERRCGPTASAEPIGCGNVNSSGSRPCHLQRGHDGWHENRDDHTWATSS